MEEAINTLKKIEENTTKYIDEHHETDKKIKEEFIQLVIDIEQLKENAKIEYQEMIERNFVIKALDNEGYLRGLEDAFMFISEACERLNIIK